VPRHTGEGPAGAVAAALAPYVWRDLTDRMLARCAVGAVDRYAVDEFLGQVPGTLAAGTGPPTPADADDERVPVLVAVLTGQQWRGWSLDRLSAHLLAGLRAWRDRQDAVETELRRLLEER
jgi:hypothetical protein